MFFVLFDFNGLWIGDERCKTRFGLPPLIFLYAKPIIAICLVKLFCKLI